MIPVEFSEIGTELSVECPEGTVQAIVADRVFIKPEKAEQHLSGPGRGEAH